MKKRLLTVSLALVMVLSMLAPAFAAEYTVRGGDTLWGIAQSQLGSGLKWNDIYEANKDTVKDPNMIFVGQKINIPDGQTTEPAKPTGMTFVPGTYTGKSTGYNGPVELNVTFSDRAVTKVEIAKEAETDHVGDVAYDIMFADILAANGSGVDAVTGASFTSRAIRLALNDAATQAKCSDLATFRKNTVKHTAQAPIEGTWDVIVVGAGGAGMAAAAQAAQNGHTVLVIEKNADIGGNTLCSGGAFQSVMPYLCWDPKAPDATEAVWDYNGKTYTKVKSGNGAIETLKTIYNWSEEPFDEDYYKTHTYEAGDIAELSKHGVHADYLETLQALKKEIKAYLDWAQPQLDAGKAETTLTLFSTVNLHIFQTYYGGLRQSADKTEWVYGNVDLVKQFITDGQEMKTWLEDQGSLFNDADQSTLIGALWWRENSFSGGDLDGDGVMNPAKGDVPAQFGTYFAVPRKTLLETSATAADNKIMLRTTAEKLIQDETGKVIGVQATQYDGTPVNVKATKGVILATGGYAANIGMVQETNKYWNTEYITASTKTTNRSSQMGDGIRMGQAVGAGVTGMGWTQMMPISWIDNGNLAFGAGNYATYINPTTGKRFVNESAERDVLSLGEFQNGISLMGSQGVFLEISNAETVVGFPYPYDTYVAPGVEAGATTGKTEIANRVYFAHNADELQAVLNKFGMKADAKTIYETIEAYDKAVMAGEQPPEVIKENPTKLVGTAEVDANGKYKPETYKLDGELIRIRLMAPSTHHTMGGLMVDTERHVLTESGAIISGLWAAGEVTGGIHGGNRLGGNAIVEIITSGRTAANSIAAESASFVPGTYTGTAQGFNGEVKVTLTVSADAITDVTVTGAGETPAIGGAALPKLAEQIKANGARIDGVSGATYTSNGARIAAGIALAAAQSKDVSDKTLTMKAGTYEASAQGFDLMKKVPVTVTIADNAITAITVGECGETMGMLDCVRNLLIPRIIEHQSLAVDAITGATSTSNAVKAAVLDACKQAGASELALYSEIPVSTAEETYTVDVVVVGMGGSGTAAAISALENGASVMAIDKAGKWGGTSAITSGPTAVNAPSQVAAEIENWNDPISKEKRTKAAGEKLVDADALYKEWTDYTTVNGVQHAKTEIISLEIDKSGETLDWLIDHGFQFGPAQGFVGGKWGIFCSYTGGKALTESFFAKAYENYTKAGGKYMLETEATELITADGKVVGVKAQKADGTKVTINAKSVILATGGFGGSDELMEKYMGEAWRLYGMAQNDGAGVRMATAVGAATYNIDMPPMSHFVAPYQIMTTFSHADNDIPYGLVCTAEALAVDQTGVRQISEAGIAMNAYTMGAKYYTIYSKEQIDVLRSQGLSANASGRYLSQGGVKADTPLTNIDAVLDKGIEMGFIYKADSLEALAKAIGGKMDAANLAASVAGYQKAAEGTDPLGKAAAQFERLGAPASDSEYYVAVTGAPYIYSTCGALDVDVEMHVLDTDGQVIPGLYAAGTDAMGVLFTNTKGYANYGGIAQGYAFVSGKTAGITAATDK